MIKTIFGALLFLAGVYCGYMAYLEAGGMHGFNTFARRFPQSLAQNDAPLALAAMGVLLPAGLFLLLFRRKRH